MRWLHGLLWRFQQQLCMLAAAVNFVHLVDWHTCCMPRVVAEVVLVMGVVRTQVAARPLAAAAGVAGAAAANGAGVLPAAAANAACATGSAVLLVVAQEACGASDTGLPWGHWLGVSVLPSLGPSRAVQTGRGQMSCPQGHGPEGPGTAAALGMPARGKGWEGLGKGRQWAQACRLVYQQRVRHPSTHGPRNIIGVLRNAVACFGTVGMGGTGIPNATQPVQSQHPLTHPPPCMSPVPQTCHMGPWTSGLPGSPPSRGLACLTFWLG